MKPTSISVSSDNQGVSLTLPWLSEGPGATEAIARFTDWVEAWSVDGAFQALNAFFSSSHSPARAIKIHWRLFESDGAYGVAVDIFQNGVALKYNECEASPDIQRLFDSLEVLAMPNPNVIANLNWVFDSRIFCCCEDVNVSAVSVMGERWLARKALTHQRSLETSIERPASPSIKPRM